MSVEQIILQGGALGVVCLIAYLLARHTTSANRELAQTNKELGNQIVELVTNHLTDSAKILDRVCNCTDNNTEALKELREEMRRK